MASDREAVICKRHSTVFIFYLFLPFSVCLASLSSLPCIPVLRPSPPLCDRGFMGFFSSTFLYLSLLSSFPFFLLPLLPLNLPFSFLEPSGQDKALGERDTHPLCNQNPASWLECSSAVGLFPLTKGHL